MSVNQFVDFKVVFSNTGELLHILPWQMAYPSMFAFDNACSAFSTPTTCEIRSFNPSIKSTFEKYTPDLTDRAELQALDAAVSWNFRGVSMTVANLPKYLKDEPAIFKLKVSSDGQVVDYEAINKTALDELSGQLPLANFETPQYPDLEKAPYGYLKMEVLGALAIRIVPWEEE